MSTTGDILQRHLDALAAGDLEGLLADYADDAVMISGPEPIRGIDALRKVFERTTANPPKIEEDLRVVEGDFAYLTWHNDRLSFGTDTFVVRDGKIVCQTVALKP